MLAEVETHDSGDAELYKAYMILLNEGIYFQYILRIPKPPLKRPISPSHIVAGITQERI